MAHGHMRASTYAKDGMPVRWSASPHSSICSPRLRGCDLHCGPPPPRCDPRPCARSALAQLRHAADRFDSCALRATGLSFARWN